MSLIVCGGAILGWRRERSGAPGPRSRGGCLSGAGRWTTTHGKIPQGDSVRSPASKVWRLEPSNLCVRRPLGRGCRHRETAAAGRTWSGSRLWRKPCTFRMALRQLVHRAEPPAYFSDAPFRCRGVFRAAREARTRRSGVAWSLMRPAWRLHDEPHERHGTCTSTSVNAHSPHTHDEASSP